MKTNTALLVALVTLTGAVLVSGRIPGYREGIQFALNDCAKENGTTEDDMETIREGGPMETRALQCLQYCVYQKVGVQNGLEFNRDACLAYNVLLFMIANMPVEQAVIEEVVDSSIAAGMAASVTDPCVIAAEVAKAYFSRMVVTEE